MKKKTFNALMIAFALIATGCSSTPSKPMLAAQVGMTKDQILNESSYKSSPTNVSRVSTGDGSMEMISFGNPPYAFMYFDNQEIVRKIVCLKYCN